MPLIEYTHPLGDGFLKKTNQKNPTKPASCRTALTKALLSLLKENTAKEKTPTKTTAGDPKKEQLVPPVSWQKSQLQEAFCSKKTTAIRQQKLGRY